MPTPTATPSPAADERYAVVLHSESEYFLSELGVSSYLNFGSGMSKVPAGATKLPFIPVQRDRSVWDSGQAEAIESFSDSEIDALGFFTRQELRDMAESAPGSSWYLFGEANRYGHITGDRFAPVMRYLIKYLKEGDPGAKMVGTSLLNWDFTCLGCPLFVHCSGLSSPQLRGYQCGKDWLSTLITTYESLYGEKPPVDAWAIDVYPIDWANTPNNDPDEKAFYQAERTFLKHSQIVAKQLEGMRAYLDTVPEYVNTPIWITEIAVHVGYDGWVWDTKLEKFVKVGDYHWDKMAAYLNEVLDWLEANAESHLIDRWFFFTTWKNIVEPPALDPYMGIIFFDGPSEGASLNCLGQVYRARVLGLSPISCDSEGNVVP